MSVARSETEQLPPLPSIVVKRCDREGCGVQHEVRRYNLFKSLRTYCSRACKDADVEGRDTFVLLRCEYSGCLRMFRRRRCEAKKSKSAFCSVDCFRSHQAETRLTPRQRLDRWNDKRYERYHSDPEYRERVLARGRKEQG